MPWTAEVTPTRQQRYRDLLAAALPPNTAAERATRARWLWRTLRSAELAGLDPTEAIGPEPATAAPDVRAAWYEALAVLGPADGPDVRGMPDGPLLHLRDSPDLRL